MFKSTIQLKFCLRVQDKKVKSGSNNRFCYTRKFYDDFPLFSGHSTADEEMRSSAFQLLTKPDRYSLIKRSFFCSTKTFLINSKKPDNVIESLIAATFSLTNTLGDLPVCVLASDPEQN